MNATFIFPPLTENLPNFNKTAKSNRRVRQLPEGTSRGGPLSSKIPAAERNLIPMGLLFKLPQYKLTAVQESENPYLSSSKRMEMQVESVINITLSTAVTQPIALLCCPMLYPARSIIMDSQRKSKPYLIPTHKSLSPLTGATSFASSASPEFPNLASLAGSFLPSKISQVRSPGAPGKAISCSSSRKACMCSPTNHPGSFRCNLHRKSSTYSSSAHSQLNARRSAMTNSLVKIGSVEGEWVRRALTALIRPSRHHMRRRSSFQPRPSRLCHMTRA